MVQPVFVKNIKIFSHSEALAEESYEKKRRIIMKKLLILALIIGFISACSFHGKQPKDDTYYKKTQGIAWPEGK